MSSLKKRRSGRGQQSRKQAVAIADIGCCEQSRRIGTGLHGRHRGERLRGGGLGRTCLALGGDFAFGPDQTGRRPGTIAVFVDCLVEIDHVERLGMNGGQIADKSDHALDLP